MPVAMLVNPDRIYTGLMDTAFPPRRPLPIGIQTFAKLTRRRV
jgi:hypothetical protein